METHIQSQKDSNNDEKNFQQKITLVKLVALTVKVLRKLDAVSYSRHMKQSNGKPSPKTRKRKLRLKSKLQIKTGTLEQLLIHIFHPHYHQKLYDILLPKKITTPNYAYTNIKISPKAHFNINVLNTILQETCRNYAKTITNACCKKTCIFYVFFEREQDDIGGDKFILHITDVYLNIPTEKIYHQMEITKQTSTKNYILKLKISN